MLHIYVCTHHLRHYAYSQPLRGAVAWRPAESLTKRVTADTFRHTFATELLRTGTMSPFDDLKKGRF